MSSVREYWKSMEMLRLAIETPEAFQPMRLERFLKLNGEKFYTLTLGDQRSIYLNTTDESKARLHLQIYNKH